MSRKHFFLSTATVALLVGCSAPAEPPAAPPDTPGEETANTPDSIERLGRSTAQEAPQPAAGASAGKGLTAAQVAALDDSDELSNDREASKLDDRTLEPGSARVRASLDGSSRIQLAAESIAEAVKAYYHEWGAFTSAAWTPPRSPGRGWVNFTGGGFRAFQNLGWTADGKVRCRYKVDAKNVDGGRGDDFEARAECIGNDGKRMFFSSDRRNYAHSGP
jgi:hypothetical protein